MPENPYIDIDIGALAGRQQEAQKAVMALPAETMAAFARDHELMRAAREHELKRLIAKYGETHPRVREKMALVDYDKTLSEAFERETDRVQKAIAFHEVDGIVVHGHVSEPNGRPAPKIELELIDERSGKAIGRAVTDRLGYFHIAIAEAARETDAPQNHGLQLQLRVVGEEQGPVRQVIGVSKTATYVDVVLTRSAKDRG